MECLKTDNEFQSVSVNLSKCDNLIHKCDEFPSQHDPVTYVNHIRKADATVNPDSNNRSKIMSISELFDVMIMSTRNMEPKQFCLPTEYLENTNLSVPATGSDLNRIIKENDGTDLVKLPLRKCYYCKKICSGDETVSCDFCPGYFHINCLSPPLCCTPDVKWMCPLHPHHFLSKIMSRPYSITELTLWWNKIAVSNDDGSVEKDFIQKTTSLKRKHRLMNSGTSRHSVKIPEMIKYHYEHSSTPPSVLQELTNPRLRRIFENNPFMIPRRNTSRTEHRKKLREEIRPKSQTLIEIISEDDSQSSGNSNTNSFVESERTAKSEDFSLWDPENKRFKFTSHGIYDYDRLGSNLKNHKFETNNFGETQMVSNPTLESRKEMNNLNGKNFSWRRLQQIINYDIQNSFDKGKRRLDESEHFNTLKKRLNQFKLHSVIGSYPPSFIPDTHPYPFHSSSFYESYLSPNKPLRKVHAVLCPLSHQALPIYMYYNTLTLGTDVQSDVHLMKYGFCEFLSDHHATIFYDEFSNAYELLNCSEYNCVIDGLCYGSNLLTKPSRTNVCRWRNYPKDMNISLSENCGKKVLPVNGIRKLAKPHSKTSLESINKNKRFQSKVTSRESLEWRYAHQKLLQEIDKLVTRSQKEMTLIANEDLNEISKILKNKKSTTVTSNKIEEIQQNPPTVFIIKRKRKILHNQKARLFSKNKRKNFGGKFAQRSPCKEKQTTELQEVAPAILSENETDQLNLKSQQCSAIKYKPLEKCDVKKELTQSVYSDRLGVDDKEPENQNVHRYCMDLAASQVEKKCECQILNSESPVGNDSSWETSAPLHHGSYIRFGCIEFVFCIVNHSTTSEEPFDEAEQVVPSSQKDDDQLETPFFDGASMQRIEDGDLSSKLTSILTILSSDSKARSESSSFSKPLSIDGEDQEQITKINASTFENESIGHDDQVDLISSSPGSVDSTPHNSDENGN